MLKKMIISILIVVLLAFTTFGQSISLGGGRISQGSRVQVTAVNTASVGQLATQMNSTREAKAKNGNLDPQEINAQLLIDAGRALKSFRSNYYTGYFISIGGMALVLIGALSWPPNAGLMIVGYLGSLVGSVWMLLSFNSVGVAGERLIRAGGGD